MTRRYTRLSPDESTALLGLYKTGVATLPELAARYAVSESSITQKARAAGITRLARFSATAGISTAVGATAALPVPIPSATTDNATHEERTRATNDAAYIGALAIQRVLDASVAAFTMPTSAGEAAATVRALEQAASVQERLNKIRRVVLRLDRENANADVVLPELPIRCMEEAEVRALRVEQELQDGGSLADRLDQLDQVQDVEATTGDGDHVEGFQEAA